MEEYIVCQKCESIASYNSYFQKYQCPFCGWLSERIEKFKGNEQYLNEFIDVLRHPHTCTKKQLEQSLIKLLNSL
jgi:ribosomal protein L37E